MSGSPSGAAGTPPPPPHPGPTPTTIQDPDREADGNAGTGKGAPEYNGQQPPRRPETHRGQLRFAERFINAYGGEFLNVHGIGWHQWDGVRWADCPDGAETRGVVTLAKDAIREMVTLSDGERKALLRDVARVESAPGIKGTLTIAGSLEPCTLAAAWLDANPYVINTASGTVDLAAGTVYPARPTDWISKTTHARFDPDARSAEFDAFLERIQPAEEMRAFLARSIGSALLGRVREHVLLIWHGTGANGKGTLRDAVIHALGDYCVTVPPELLLQTRYGSEKHAPEKMRLRGARIAFCSEISHDVRLDEAIMKTLVGGDPINACLKYHNPVEFQPSHTLIMLTNFLPKVRADDPATWRRIRAVPFDVVIPESDWDEQLPERLAGHADAVLAWLWRGWLDYSKHGLNPPETVLAATRQYRRDSDLLTGFLADESAVLDGHGTVLSGPLYRAFVGWCHARGDEPRMTHKTFTEAMEKRGYTRRITRAGAEWRSISLVPESDSQLRADR